ncbi:MAG: peptidoglycan-binding protein [Lachnospiraceae bacterium]|nr:peptidoglycan-binding protein [Lachnospiraceae bacterium]
MKKKGMMEEERETGRGRTISKLCGLLISSLLVGGMPSGMTVSTYAAQNMDLTQNNMKSSFAGWDNGIENFAKSGSVEDSTSREGEDGNDGEDGDKSEMEGNGSGQVSSDGEEDSEDGNQDGEDVTPTPTKKPKKTPTPTPKGEKPDTDKEESSSDEDGKDDEDSNQDGEDVTPTPTKKPGKTPTPTPKGEKPEGEENSEGDDAAPTPTKKPGKTPTPTPDEEKPEGGENSDDEDMTPTPTKKPGKTPTPTPDEEKPEDGENPDGEDNEDKEPSDEDGEQDDKEQEDEGENPDGEGEPSDGEDEEEPDDASPTPVPTKKPSKDPAWAVPTQSDDARYQYLLGIDSKVITIDNPPAGYRNATEAAKNMKTITIPIWKMSSSGGRYTSSAKLTIHKKLARNVQEIFKEIYALDIKFPIKVVKGFMYRKVGGVALSKSRIMSIHSFGAAIDINPGDYDNDYFLGKGNDLRDKSNPYCIPDEVIAIFEKYGWFWGGNFEICADTMHFQYFELGMLTYQGNSPFRNLKVKSAYMTGSDVRNLQQRLRELGFYVSVDGVYGNKTADAIKKYQKSRGLEATGEMDYKTWETIINETHYMSYVF